MSIVLFMIRLLLVLCLLATTAHAERPNVVVVFVDDMGFGDLSCFGGIAAETEHIDQLAAEGIRFTQFYVNSPICSPSRTSLTTGQYPQRWRITSYLNHRESNDQRGVAQWLDPTAPSLARELQKNGYATGHFGKWHMGGQRDVGEAPLISEYGFEKSLTNFEGLGPRVLGYKDAYDGTIPGLHDLRSDSLGKGPIFYVDRSTVTSAFVYGAIHFIDQAVKADRPFFVNVWPDDPHGPWFPPEHLREQSDGSKPGLYAAVLEAMDDQLAPLFDRIRKGGKTRRNTIILFCSDNGHEIGAGTGGGLRGGKTWLYEGGVRSPLIVWAPGLIDQEKAGTTNETSVFSAMDLNRSLYALTNTPLPEAVELDGEDVSAALLGKSDGSRGAPLFFRRPPDRPGFGHGLDEDNPDLAVRDGKWKYLVNLDGSEPQLYDLVADAAETTNLASDHPDIVERLHTAVTTWNASLPKDATDPTWVAE